MRVHKIITNSIDIRLWVRNTSWPAEAVNGKAQADFFEFLEANVKPSPTQVASSNPETLVWKIPEEGLIKINVDAAISKATSTIGTGAIARNANGSILGIFTKSYEGLTSPRLAEAMAIRNGMNLGVALNVGRVLIESDAESIVRSCSMSKNPPSDIAVLVQDCLALKDSFQLCDFNFVKRDCNRAAHACAKKALSCSLSGLWTTTLSLWGSSLSDG
ncbi:uncharacterized protein LOC131302880 [Rhododendron vialii]|uniref:uncharacterized protein LOC131302880 n=1 Tax=Rhododendron vialii TaxID=182163 RepID=UPI00265E004F|nr:uncharacterized protein LOC131302880 [Rhododendron vialii]